MDNGGVEVRAARAEEADDILRVLCAAFALPYAAARPIFHADPFFDLSHKRLLRTPQDGIVSCLTVVPTRIRVGRAWVPLAGIAGVATHPAFRRRGHAAHLLAATVPALADELGYPLSGLFTLSEGLYRRFGWETATSAVRRLIPLAALPHPAESVTIRADSACDGTAQSDARALHASLDGARTGGCARDERRWRLIETATGRAYAVYQPPGEPLSGYAFWERHGANLHLLEMRAATQKARASLLGHLARQALAETHLEWTPSPAEWAAAGLTDLCQTQTQAPGLMLRLTDLRAALAAVHAENLAPVLARSGRTLTLRAGDSRRPENSRPVRLAPEGVTLDQRPDADWISGDIAALAPIYLGLHSPSHACAAGHLRASSPSALALADELFPPRDPFVAPLDQF